MDTRTRRTIVPPLGRSEEDGKGAGGTARGFVDDDHVLSTVRIPCDPAQVVVNHVSFRVQLAGPPPRNSAFDPARERAARERAIRLGTVAAGDARAGIGAGAGAGAGAVTRRAPVVWSGRTRPGDTGATRLLQAVRVPASGYSGGFPDDESANATTQTLPLIGGPAAPHIVGPRAPQDPERALGATEPLLSGIRPVQGAYDDPAAPLTAAAGRGAGGAAHRGPAGGAGLGLGPGPDVAMDPALGLDAGLHAGLDADADPAAAARDDRRRNNSVRHAYYPGRRMNLGVVLLPLRIFLGFISIYAGMGKLCDPVYFDGGERGSILTWLHSLEPWAIAAPLHEFALAHPVGAGLSVAFLQIIVGVLTVCGLWQRLAACVGALLSAALIVTVSWRTVPAYDAPDIIYLATWSPLIIAGAPVYSMDARLAGEAWRTLGPRVEVMDLRRRVLRRGTTLAAVVCGAALLVGALLGGAVRSTQTVTVPGPGEPPRNHLPGSPLPQEPRDGAGRKSKAPGAEPSGADRSPSPEASRSGAPDAAGSESAVPTQQQTVRAPQPSAPAAAEPAPAPTPTAGVSDGGTGAGASTPGGGSTAGGTAAQEAGQGTGSGSTVRGGSGSGSSGGGEGGTSGGGRGGGALGGLL